MATIIRLNLHLRNNNPCAAPLLPSNALCKLRFYYNVLSIRNLAIIVFKLTMLYRATFVRQCQNKYRSHGGRIVLFLI